MTDLEKIAIPELQKMLMPDKLRPIEKLSIGLALSGGVDSMVLLSLLLSNDIKKLCGNLTAFHFNHGLRGEAADQDELFLKEYCLKLGINFYSEKIAVLDLVKDSGKTVEEAARELRYQRLSELKLEYNIDLIFLAHHEDDKAETVFFNIMRGCGLSGLAALKPITGFYRRPLLSVSKSSIVEYAQKAQLPVREDLTNRENDYSRNKIRNLLIPQIEQSLQRNIVPSLIRLSKIADESLDFITESCARFLSDGQSVLLQNDSAVIKRDAYLGLHPCLGKELLGQIFTKLGSCYRPAYLMNDMIYTKIENGKSFLEKWQNYDISLWQNFVFIAKNHRAGSAKVRINFDQFYEFNNSSLTVSRTHSPDSGYYIAAEAVQGELSTVVLDKNIEFQPFGRNSFTPINKLLSDKKIPHFLRNRMFMLVDEEKVVFIPGIGIDNRVRVTKESVSILSISVSDPVFDFTGTKL